MHVERSQTLEPLFPVVLVEPAQQMQVGDCFRETDRPLIDGSVTDATAAGLTFSIAIAGCVNLIDGSGRSTPDSALKRSDCLKEAADRLRVEARHGILFISG